VFFTRFSSVPGQYAIIVKGLRTMPRLVSAQMARESGMSPEEIRMFPADESHGIPGAAPSAFLKRLKGRPA
jgi:hypothetical protein